MLHMYHEDIQGHHPIIAPLKSVEIRMEKISARDKEKSPWLYWTWETKGNLNGDGLNHGYGCGYSGIAGTKDWEEYHLEEQESCP